MILTFMPDEVQAVRNWAKGYTAYKDAMGCKTKLFADYSHETLLCMGKFGECAASVITGATVNWDIQKQGDGGNDLHAYGLDWQVKTSTLHKLIFLNLDEFSSDGAILVNLLSTKEKMFDCPSFEVMGGISKNKFSKVHYENDFGYGARVACDAKSLTPLDKIKRSLENEF
jgi:hypothetical protein